ncbi:hypothetical protein PV08_10560 [Exophiala spinifera]|uniref:CorA-like transporter domain-containing protein n=1 Tax=Exophiala spinifera TaxID=91928 RepID=A0A0D2AXT5_9EURO|nr:uncharacterized protein PV08_10560 [Exophiala spinifera]KIW11260.1 hypothetical protein PV08_10560 [Exophiala spinifera]
MTEDVPSWARYPLSLSPEICNPYACDLAHYSRILEQNSKRLFMEDGERRIKVIEVGIRELIISSFEGLDNYLTTSRYSGLRLILIPQRFSWDRLMISDRALRRLAHHFGIFPEFLDVVTAFGERIVSDSDSVGGFRSHSGGQAFECAYLAKTVEEHGRDDDEDPWSIRQMGIYSQREANKEATTFIIINPLQTFLQRLKDAQAGTGEPPAWRDIHRLALSSSTTPWRQYTSYLETQMTQLKTRAHLSSVSDKEPTGSLPTIRIEFEDTQDVKVLEDKLYRLRHVLNMNLQVCREVGVLFTQYRQSCDPGIMPATCPSDPATFGFIAEIEIQLERILTLKQRTEAVSDLMQKIIAFRALAALKTSSSMSTEIARLAQSDNKIMVDLATKSRDDAQILKTITILTMIYLPAAFVSVSNVSGILHDPSDIQDQQFLSMGYLDIRYGQHTISLHFAGEMWIFGILTVILLGVTIGSWLWLERRRRQRRDLLLHARTTDVEQYSVGLRSED